MTFARVLCSFLALPERKLSFNILCLYKYKKSLKMLSQFYAVFATLYKIALLRTVGIAALEKSIINCKQVIENSNK